MNYPSIAEVRERLDYDPATGHLTWIRGRRRGRRAGSSRRDGYRRIVFGTEAEIPEHRVVWAWYFHVWPKGILDHINRDPQDNRICNLRHASKSDNSIHRRRLPRTSSRFRGVTWHRQLGKWQAAICHHGQRHYLGVFESEPSAARAYDEAAREMHGAFACLNFAAEEVPA